MANTLSSFFFIIMKPTSIVDTTTQSQIDFSFRHFRIKRLEIINYLLTQNSRLFSSPMTGFTAPCNGRGRKDEMCILCSVLTIFFLLRMKLNGCWESETKWRVLFPLAGSGDAIVNKAAKLSIKKFIFLFSKLLNTVIGGGLSFWGEWKRFGMSFDPISKVVFYRNRNELESNLITTLKQNSSFRLEKWCWEIVCVFEQKVNVNANKTGTFWFLKLLGMVWTRS